MNDEVKQVCQLVWRFRALMDEAGSPWVTPEPVDALRFAVTEVAEAMDAWLRARGGFAATLMDARFGRVRWGPRGQRMRTKGYWRKPLKWNEKRWWRCLWCGWRGDESHLEPDDEMLLQPKAPCPACNHWQLEPARAWGGFARNHERDERVFAELADCAIMLATAIPDYVFSGGEAWGSYTLDGLVYQVAGVLQTAALGGVFAFRAAAALYAIAAYEGMDLEREVKDRLISIMLRHTTEGSGRAVIAQLLEG